MSRSLQHGSVDSYETQAGTRWRARYRKRDDSGRWRTIAKAGHPSRPAAERWLRAQLVDVDHSRDTDPSRLTVRGYLREEWLPAKKPIDPTAPRGHRGKVSPATWDGYRRDLERYVIPAIGNVLLQQLEARHLDALYNELETTGGRSGNGLAPKTLQNIHALISKALKDAVRRGRVARNVAGDVEPPKAEKPKTGVWTLDQLVAFLRHSADDELFAGWVLLASTGARRGEVCGLTWDDLDLDRGTMRIDWTLGHVGHTMTWKPRPKTDAGRRIVALDADTVATLKAHRARQAQQRLAAGSAWDDTFVDWQGLERSGLVWTRADGSIIHPKTWTERFLRLSKKAGLPRIRLHDIRHTYATAALEGATTWKDVRAVSERLGHSKVAITVDTYEHVLEDVDRGVADAFGKRLHGGLG